MTQRHAHGTVVGRDPTTICCIPFHSNSSCHGCSATVALVVSTASRQC
jgi:hypothetical protein